LIDDEILIIEIIDQMLWLGEILLGMFGEEVLLINIHNDLKLLLLIHQKVIQNDLIENLGILLKVQLNEKIEV
jgi:hypothetical protein